jgi:hypothetical protein
VPGIAAAENTEENMMVTAGDAITVLNSKDISIKTYVPPAHQVAGHSHQSSSGSLIEHLKPSKFT